MEVLYYERVEQFPGMPTIALGQKNIPGIAQSLILEDATILTKQDIVDGAKKVLSTKVSGETTVSYIPPRYFIN